MKIIFNDIIPFRGFAAINIFGILFVRKHIILTDEMINHERIHTAQMKELLYVLFYIIYFLEWLLRLIQYRSKAYVQISFEREAYSNDQNLEYLKSRKSFAFLKFL